MHQAAHDTHPAERSGHDTPTSRSAVFAGKALIELACLRRCQVQDLRSGSPSEQPTCRRRSEVHIQFCVLLDSDERPPLKLIEAWKLP